MWTASDRSRSLVQSSIFKLNHTPEISTNWRALSKTECKTTRWIPPQWSSRCWSKKMSTKFSCWPRPQVLRIQTHRQRLNFRSCRSCHLYMSWVSKRLGLWSAHSTTKRRYTSAKKRICWSTCSPCRSCTRRVCAIRHPWCTRSQNRSTSQLGKPWKPH